MKNLQYYLENKHVRYMPENVQDELMSLVPNCKGTPAEAMFWVIQGLTDYPCCEACGTKLSSFHWEPFLKPGLRKNKDVKQGYRPFCSRSCAYTHGTKKQSYKETSRKKYGVDHPMQSKEVVEKIKQTNLQKTGESWPNRWGSARFENFIKKKYGVSKVRHIPQVHHTTVESIAKATTERIRNKVKEIEKLFEVQYVGGIPDGMIYRMYDYEITWKHHCGRVYTSHISERGIRRCPVCSSGKSRGETAVFEFVKSLAPDAVQGDRRAIAPKELDIYVPSAKLAIEYDGTYWHSAKFTNASKSVEKLDLCTKAGIKLISLQEYLWENCPEKVKSRIEHALNPNLEKIPARKCKVQEITREEASDFLNQHHLQGSGGANTFLGLKYKDELVMVTTFGKPRWAKKYDWELIRSASKTGVRVQGGLSKLIKEFRENNPGSIVSYSDRCWGEGESYKKAGFKFSHSSKPSYWWCNHSLGTYARYQTQKGKLQKLLENLGKEFDPNMSERDNMLIAGFLQIFDRGNNVWVLS